MIKHLFPLALLLSVCSPLALAHLVAQKDKPCENADIIRVLSAQPIYETLEYPLSNFDCGPLFSPGLSTRQTLNTAVSCRAAANRAERAEEVVAYRVHYRYHGHDYITEMPYDPGSRLPADFDAQPIRW